MTEPGASNQSEGERQLRQLEQRRSDAMDSGDADTLNDVYAEEFQLVHGDGTLDDKRGAIEAARRVPRRVVAKRELSVRIFGDTALLTGPVGLAVTIDAEERTVQVYMTQIARVIEGRWQFIWAQVTLRARAGAAT